MHLRCVEPRSAFFENSKVCSYKEETRVLVTLVLMRWIRMVYRFTRHLTSTYIRSLDHVTEHVMRMGGRCTIRLVISFLKAKVDVN